MDTLYKKNKNGSYQEWTISTQGPDIITRYGQVSGQLQITTKRAIGKNIGKSNEVSPQDQAIKEATSMWKKKLDNNYALSIAEANNVPILPMLAKNYEDHKGKIDWSIPHYINPKYDGCIFRTTKIQTDQGIKTIEDIVENKLKVNVLSHNVQEGTFEYKPIINWFKNGEIHYKDWIEVVPKIGKLIKCTLNHKFLTEDGWIEADKLNKHINKIYINQHSAYLNNLIAGTVLGDSTLVIDKRGTGINYRLIFTHTSKKLMDFKIKTLNLEGKVTKVTTGYGSIAQKFISTTLTNTNFPIDKFYYTGTHRLVGTRKIISAAVLREMITPEALSLWIADDGNLFRNNGNKNTPQLTISTHRFPKEQITEFCRYFKQVWNCEPSVYTDKRVINSNGQFLRFSTKDTFYILTALRDKQCEGVEYKYFYKTEGHIPQAKREFKFHSFHTRNSRRMLKAMKYDIEVKDNHNYVANNIVVHNCRSIARWVDGKVKLFSRKNKEWIHLSHIAKALEHILPPDFIIDGEIYLHGLTIQEISSLTKKHRTISTLNCGDVNTNDLQYYVYDGFYEGHETQKYATRSSYIEAHIDDISDKVICAPAHKVTCQKEIDTLNIRYVTQGYEGLIFRTSTAPYVIGHRSSDLLKIKTFQDAEFEIVDYYEGVGRFKGAVTWVCKLDDIGNTVDCVPMGTMEQKRDWFTHGKDYIGKLLKIKYFGYTDTGSLRFPVGLGIRMEEDM